MLARAMLIGMRNDLRRDEEIGWALVRDDIRRARLRLRRLRLTPGARADLALVDASCAAEAVAQRAARLVLTGGVVAARYGQDAVS